MLGGLRARLDDEPILVVPTFGDVEHAQRELADRGAVFGARVLRFEWLFEEIAARAGYGEPRGLGLPARADRGGGGPAREAERARGVRGAAGFRARRGALRDRAGAAPMVDPPRFTQRAARSGPATARGARYADEVAGVYRPYRDGPRGRRARRRGAVRLARARRAAARAASAGAARRVFAYGFDDFTPLQLDALETLAGAASADVTVSLPFEPRRAALSRRWRACTRSCSRSAPTSTSSTPVDDHYAPESRAALHHLERLLFEDVPAARGRARAARLVPLRGRRARRGRAGGGAGAAAAARRASRRATWPWCSATPRATASLLEQVFGAYGIPYSIDRKLPFGHTGLGRGLLALHPRAAPGGTAEDLLAYLRTPGPAERARAGRPAGGRRAQGGRAQGRAGARALGARPLAARRARPARARAARRGGASWTELDRGSSACSPPRTSAAPPCCSGPELDDARALQRRPDGARASCARCSGASRAGRGAACCACSTAGGAGGREPAARSRAGGHPGGDPRAALRGGVRRAGSRRASSRAAPRPSRSSPTPTAARSRTASGLVLPLREDHLDRERYLFYVCASRAERLLVLSSRSSDEEGNPQAQSFFVDDVRDLLGDGAELRTPLALRRHLDRRGRAHRGRVGARARGRAARGARSRAPGPLTRRAAPRAPGRARGRLGRRARALRRLPGEVARGGPAAPGRARARPRGDGARLLRARGARAHLPRGCARRPASGASRTTNLADAERILLEALRERRGGVPPVAQADARARGGAPARVRPPALPALGGRVRHALRARRARARVRRSATARSPSSSRAACACAGGSTAWTSRDGKALVIDYKSGRSVDRYKVASWEPENRFQAALYMLVVERAARPARGRRRLRAARRATTRGRAGWCAADVDELGSGYLDNDRLTRGVPEQARLGARADRARRRRACAAASSARAGSLRLERRLLVPVDLQERG